VDEKTFNELVNGRSAAPPVLQGQASMR